MSKIPLASLLITLFASILAHGEERLTAVGFSGTGIGKPLRMGGEISVETEHFRSINITAGYLDLIPLSDQADPFEAFQGVEGFGGFYLGLRHRFKNDLVTPFIGINALEHLLSSDPYISVNPEAGIAIKLSKHCELSAQARYFVTSRGQDNNFLLGGIGLTWVFL
jgi:hypothetical protein